MLNSTLSPSRRKKCFLNNHKKKMKRVKLAHFVSLMSAAQRTSDMKINSVTKQTLDGVRVSSQDWIYTEENKIHNVCQQHAKLSYIRAVRRQRWCVRRSAIKSAGRKTTLLSQLVRSLARKEIIRVKTFQGAERWQVNKWAAAGAVEKLKTR